MNNTKFNLKDKLIKKEVTIGSWLGLGHPAISELMAKAGYDWLCIDLEHSAITLREAENLIRIIELSGVTPLVRLSSNDSVQIKRVMDSGAHGVIVPMVNTPKEAEQAVQSVYYPPKGNRSVGLARAQKYGIGFEEYQNWLANEAIVIVQIEHIQAVENLKEILSVEGIDGFIVGPYDLSASMGFPGQFEQEQFLKAMDKITHVAAPISVSSGYHVVPPDPKIVRKKIAEGYTFIAYSVDFMFFKNGCQLDSTLFFD